MYYSYILSCLVSNVYFNFIVQDSLYYGIVHWSAASYRSLYDWFGVCAFLALSVILCSFSQFFDIMLFHHDGCGFCFLWPFYPFQVHIWAFCDYLVLDLQLRTSGDVSVLRRCFCLWTFYLHIGLNMLLSDTFRSCLHFLLRYSTGEFQALIPVNGLSLWCLVPCELTACLPPIFWKFSLKLLWIWRFYIMENTFFIVCNYFLHIFWCLTMWWYFIFICLIFMSQTMFYFSHSTLVLSFKIDVVLTLSIYKYSISMTFIWAQAH